MTISNKMRQKREQRRTAIQEMAPKYPNGFTVRNVMEEHSELFQNDAQIRDFLQQEFRVHDSVTIKLRGGIQHYYIKPNLYKMFHDLMSRNVSCNPVSKNFQVSPTK